MSSEISEGDIESYHGNSWAFGDDTKLCGCGERVGRWTSWTKSNPARRFVGCRRWQDKSRKCGVWEWIDPELTDYYKEQMWILKQKLMNLESSKEVENRLGLRTLKLLELEHEIEGLKRKNVELEKECDSLKLMNVQLDREMEKLKLKIERMKTKETILQDCVSKGKGREQFQLIVILSLLLIVGLLMSFSQGEISKLKLPM